MTDENLRRLERRWKETGDERDCRALLEARRRAGIRLKLVLHSMAMKEGPMFSPGRRIHNELETRTGIPLEYHACGDFLVDEALERFVELCRDADVVLLDAWTTPKEANWPMLPHPDPHLAMAEVARRIREVAPEALIMAQLMEGINRVAVHEYAEPFNYWADRAVCTALIRFMDRDTPLST